MILSTVCTSTSSRPWERDELVSLLDQDVASIWVAESPRRRFTDRSTGFRDLGERGVDLDGHHDLLAESLDLDRLGRRDVVARLRAHLAPDPDGAAGPV